MDPLRGRLYGARRGSTVVYLDPELYPSRGAYITTANPDTGETFSSRLDALRLVEIPRSGRVAVISHDSVIVWDLATTTTVWSKPFPRGGIGNALAILEDGSVAVASEDDVRVYDANTGDVLSSQPWPKTERSYPAIVITPDGFVVAGNLGGWVLRFSVYDSSVVVEDRKSNSIKRLHYTSQNGVVGIGEFFPSVMRVFPLGASSDTLDGVGTGLSSYPDGRVIVTNNKDETFVHDFSTGGTTSIPGSTLPERKKDEGLVMAHFGRMFVMVGLDDGRIVTSLRGVGVVVRAPDGRVLRTLSNRGTVYDMIAIREDGQEIIRIRCSMRALFRGKLIPDLVSLLVSYL